MLDSNDEIKDLSAALDEVGLKGTKGLQESLVSLTITALVGAECILQATGRCKLPSFVSRWGRRVVDDMSSGFCALALRFHLINKRRHR
jgi:hypothetical protein